MVVWLLSWIVSASATAEEVPPENRAGRSNDTWFYLNPGITTLETAVRITGRGREALLDTENFQPALHLDVQSPDYQLTDWFGLQIVLQNGVFKTDTQLIEHQILSPPYYAFPSLRGVSEDDSGDADADEEKSSSSKSDGGRSRPARRSEQNIGTRTQGTYNIFVPSAYIGSAGFRFGLGVGFGTVSMRGGVDFNNPFLRAGVVRAAFDRQFVSQYSSFYYASGLHEINDDPVIRYLMTDIGEGNRLETFGLYMITGRHGAVQPLDLLWMKVLISQIEMKTGATPQLNDLELCGLIAMQRGVIGFRDQPAGAYIAFLEVPHFYPGFNLRFDFGGPVFTRDSFRYEFRMLRMALFFPIQFGENGIAPTRGWGWLDNVR